MWNTPGGAQRREKTIDLLVEYQAPFKVIPGAAALVPLAGHTGAWRIYVDGREIAKLAFDKTLRLRVRPDARRLEIWSMSLTLRGWVKHRMLSNSLDVYRPREQATLVYCRLRWDDPDKLICKMDSPP